MYKSSQRPILRNQNLYKTFSFFEVALLNYFEQNYDVIVYLASLSWGRVWKQFCSLE